MFRIAKSPVWVALAIPLLPFSLGHFLVLENRFFFQLVAVLVRARRRLTGKRAGPGLLKKMYEVNPVFFGLQCKISGQGSTSVFHSGIFSYKKTAFSSNLLPFLCMRVKD